MSLSDEIAKLRKSLNKMAKGHVKVQTVWAKVKSVDWDKKQMTATGVIDELDYYNVLLGLGNVYRKPVVGKLCLLGIIENQNAASFLIDAGDVEDVVIVITEELSISAKDLTIAITNDIAISANSTVFNDGNNGGIPVESKIMDNLNAIKNYVETMNTAIIAALGIVDGSAGSVSQEPYQTTMSAANMNLENMENEDVKH